MTKQAIHSPDAPAAIGPYSQAIRTGDTLWMSGQIPLDPTTMAIVDGGIEAQAGACSTHGAVLKPRRPRRHVKLSILLPRTLATSRK
jgi:enamine deaminase RidA (YjgF/YER057c/UK114 family)